jgi:type VI secretion system secreted protein Hcp
VALNAYMKLKGQKTGVVKGPVAQKGRENSILVFAAGHEIVSPRDPASGLPTGKRMHKPFTISKEVDRASPVLYSMLVNNENITELVLQFWTPSGTGAENQHYTVKLSNARIASIHFVLPNNTLPETQRLKEYEEITFTYQKIQWTWNDGGISAQDDWTTPVP